MDLIVERGRLSGGPAQYREATLAAAEVLAEARAIRRYASFVRHSARVLLHEFSLRTPRSGG